MDGEGYPNIGVNKLVTCHIQTLKSKNNYYVGVISWTISWPQPISRKVNWSLHSLPDNCAEPRNSLAHYPP